MEDGKSKACCGASRAGPAPAGDPYLAAARDVPHASPDTRSALRAGLIDIPGGIFEMGTRKSRFPDDLDAPRRKVKLSSFLMSPLTVTNADYARFIAETGYETVAEVEGWSYVFHLLLADRNRYPVHPPGLSWWRRVEGASWCQPEGPGTDWRDRHDHPAVHLSWYDCLAYVTWAGLRLPREAEWERAARGGLKNRKFPWGNTLVPEGGFAMNTWQGEFPITNTAEDGYVGTAPASAYAPNAYGLYNMTGNVWEWVHDSYGPRSAPGLMPEIDPTGPEDGHQKIQRGGSFLCHESYCDRYQVHSRNRNDADSSTSNCGFRVAADPEG
ncbi:formylglycine-generating enzyme family protein [Martelella sp. HB161492]|uniref:formylglycine-generating enzyme family protein n=1 Tax=Martelella sp. HB161492 TaxID=2720726 RepID=UPI0015908677|nr:formylglycine-generating enzyme family protein [Martelella sp. HB161492]